MENYSLSDIVAATNGEGFGGSNAWVMIILFALIFGGGGFGFGNNNAATTQEILFGQQFQNLDNKIDRIGNGIADATFALNNAITTEGRNVSGQVADGTQRILDAISKNKIDDLQAQISNLQLQNAMCGVVRYPNATTYGANWPFNNGGCGCNGNI